MKKYCVSYLTTYYHDFYIEAENESEAWKISEKLNLDEANEVTFGESEVINIEIIREESC